MRKTLLALLGSALVAPASAAEVTYTDTHGPHCRQHVSHGELSEFTCKGPAGRMLSVADAVMVGNLRYGPSDEALQPSTRITGDGIGKKVEWRMEGGRPYAAIHRMFTPGGSVLVVTRLDAKAACHAGYVDGRMPNANTLAAGLADTARLSFHCGTDKPRTVGRRLYGVES